MINVEKSKLPGHAKEGEFLLLKMEYTILT